MIQFRTKKELTSLLDAFYKLIKADCVHFPSTIKELREQIEIVKKDGNPELFEVAKAQAEAELKLEASELEDGTFPEDYRDEH